MLVAVEDERGDEGHIQTLRQIPLRCGKCEGGRGGEAGVQLLCIHAELTGGIQQGRERVCGKREERLMESVTSSLLPRTKQRRGFRHAQRILADGEDGRAEEQVSLF